jgi:polysaccharide biosynthesis protein VpsM
MSFRHLIRVALAASSLGCGCHALPVLTIGDVAEVLITGSLGVRADDNVFLAQEAEGDVIIDLAPGVELTFGKNARLKGRLTLVNAFSGYIDHRGLNTSLFSAEFVSRHDDGKRRLGFDAEFRELNQNTFSVRPSVSGLEPGLVRRDRFATTALAEVELSGKTAATASLTFDRDTYKLPGYADAAGLTLPLDVFYRWTPKTDLSLGYRFRDTRVEIGEDSTDHFFNLGARGEFTPKIAGRIALGLNRRNLRGGRGDTQVGLDATLAYAVTPKTNLEFGATNDFGTSPQGQQLKNTSVRGLLTTKFSPEWSVSAGLTWRAIDYGARTDDFLEGQLNATFVVSRSLRLTALYIHRNYASEIRLNEFRNNVISLSAQLRL